MIKIKSEEEIALIAESCRIVSHTLASIASEIKPGVSGTKLDEIAEQVIRSEGGVPGFKGYRGFPASLCISINDQVVHGIPSDDPIKDGDIVSVDCGVKKEGYYGDSAFTFAVGDAKPEVLELMRVTRLALDAAISEAHFGKRLGDIGYAVQNLCESEHNYGVVRDMVGHGIGKDLHEEPEVPNYGRRGNGMKLQENLVIAIEPMVNLSTRKIATADDGWTIVTRDGSPSAHYEHTVVVRKNHAEKLTSFDKIDEAVKKTAELSEIA